MRDIGVEINGDIVVIDMWNAIMNEALKNTPGGNQTGSHLGSKDLGKSEALVNLMPDGLHRTYSLLLDLTFSAWQ